jgi:hypothetical protein
MAIRNELLIEQLLNESESSTLDFKEQQYGFVGAIEEEKSELLKDILSFTNAFRRTDAYILIGVKEIKGARSIPVGIHDELDDASLQQFVNSKTQKPVTFTYYTIPIQGVKVGLIHVPVQERPIYLLKDYGKLKKGKVYIRRGTSTGEASPDEIVNMRPSMEDRTISGIPAKVLEYMVTDANQRLDSMPEADEVIQALGITADEYKSAVEELEALGMAQTSRNANHPSGYARARLTSRSFIQRIGQAQRDIDIISEVKRVLEAFGNEEQFVSSKRVMERAMVPLVRLQIIVDFLQEDNLIEVRKAWLGDNKPGFSYGRLLPLGKRVLKGEDPIPVLNMYLS